jgi:two-component system, chemotaxis family, sensor kinase CheA
LLTVFSAEAAERIQRVNAALLALERGDEAVDVAEALTGIMRELHTLKGAGGSVNLEDVETLSRDLESVFGPIQRGERDLSDSVYAVAYRTLDAIGEIIAAAVEERSAVVDVPALVAQLRAVADGLEVPGTPTAPPADVEAEKPQKLELELELELEPEELQPLELKPEPEQPEDEAASPFAELVAETADLETETTDVTEGDVANADVDRDDLLRSFAALQDNPFASEFAALSDLANADTSFASLEPEADEPSSDEFEPADNEPADTVDESDETETVAEPEPTETEPEPALAGEIGPHEVELDGHGIEPQPEPAAELEPVDEPTSREPETDPEPVEVAAGAEPEPAYASAADADAPRAQVLAVFAAESLDRVKTINRRLMTLERDPSSEMGANALSEIMRELHTLKGSSATVHVEPVESLAHQLEALLGAVRDGGRKLDAPVFDIAYRALDAVEAAVGEAVRGDAPQFDEDAWSASIRATLGGPEPPSDEPVADDLAHAPDVRSPAEPRPDLPAPAVPEPAASHAAVGADDTVRVAVAKLDALMGSVSELHAARAATEQRLSDVRTMLTVLSGVEAGWLEADARVRSMLAPAGEAPGAVPPIPVDVDEVLSHLDQARLGLSPVRTKLERLLQRMESDGRRIAQVTDDLQDDVRRARMLPVSMVFDVFPRLIRDLSVDLGKKASLSIEGADTEVDRAVIEQIRAPLTHLLRNAIDHGLETPAEREQAGKRPEGTISLSASQQGDTLLIEIGDDGAGIDPNTIRALAVVRGVLSQEAADATNDAEALRLIFKAGFSTRDEVTDLSGRGVGLDVVRDAIERLRGSVEVASVVGEQTRFSLTVPLSVATAQCVMVRVAGVTFALPISNVTKILRVTRDETERADGRVVIAVEGQPVPIASVSDALGIDGAAQLDGSPLPAVLLGSGERRVAFLVDELIGTQTLVLKALPPPFVRLRHISGAAILGTGEVVGVLNAADLVRADDPSAALSTTFDRREPSGDRTDSPLVLVVDDSSVTRTMVKGILEAAGYRVQTAADGMQAWEMLRSRSFDLLVSDVNMPEMSGFDLTEKVRSDRFLRGVPVILVTALDSLEDQAHGSRVGADAYITKGSFTDDSLLETVRSFV